MSVVIPANVLESTLNVSLIHIDPSKLITVPNAIEIPATAAVIIGNVIDNCLTAEIILGINVLRTLTN